MTDGPDKIMPPAAQAIAYGLFAQSLLPIPGEESGDNTSGGGGGGEGGGGGGGGGDGGGGAGGGGETIVPPPPPPPAHAPKERTKPITAKLAQIFLFITIS